MPIQTVKYRKVPPCAAGLLEIHPNPTLDRMRPNPETPTQVPGAFHTDVRKVTCTALPWISVKQKLDAESSLGKECELIGGRHDALQRVVQQFLDRYLVIEFRV